VPYVGTGWLVEKDAIATNRHVAREFAQGRRDRFTFKKEHGSASTGVSVDFLEEAGRTEELSFPIVEILHIEDDDGPDFALLRVGESRGQALAQPIPLSMSPPQAKQQVAVMGYPARDSRAPDAQLVQDIFGDVFDKKRLAPGQVTEAKADVLLHDCSTLGGNSGSVVLDLETGHAVGLHFAGRFLQANYAVPAKVVAERLERARHPRPGKPSSRPPQGPVTPPGHRDADTGLGDDRQFRGVRRRRAGGLHRAHRVRPAVCRRRCAAARGAQHQRRPHLPLGWPPGIRAQVPTLLGGDEPEPASLYLQRPATSTARRRAASNVLHGVSMPAFLSASKSETNATETSRSSRAAT
jgi:hypothetical protein